MPVKQLNELRREALEELQNKLLEAHRREKKCSLCRVSEKKEKNLRSYS